MQKRSASKKVCSLGASWLSNKKPSLLASMQAKTTQPASKEACKQASKRSNEVSKEPSKQASKPDSMQRKKHSIQKGN
jgi:hypothetical protein